MPRKYWLILIVLLAALIIGSVFSLNKNKAEKLPEIAAEGKVKVSASFYPLYYLLKEIGGDKVEVKNMTPAGAEPHDYEPTAADMAYLYDSRLIVLNGGGLEPWAADLDANLNRDNNLLIRVGDGLMTKEMTEDGEVMRDPHVWLSPRLYSLMADKVVAALVSVDGGNRDYYEQRLGDLKNRLNLLDSEYYRALSVCAGKNIITAHAAFAYLAEAYDLKQIAIAGLSPEAEPSPREMAEIVESARAGEIKYIFFESLVSPKLAETIAREIGAQTLALNPLEGLTDREMSEGKDYFSVMRDNLSNLQTALSCQK